MFPKQFNKWSNQQPNFGIWNERKIVARWTRPLKIPCSIHRREVSSRSFFTLWQPAFQATLLEILDPEQNTTFKEKTIGRALDTGGNSPGRKVAYIPSNFWPFQIVTDYFSRAFQGLETQLRMFPDFEPSKTEGPFSQLAQNHWPVCKLGRMVGFNWLVLSD